MTYTEVCSCGATNERARFVADHWRLAAMKHDKTFAAHALCMVLAALDGETDPRMLGIDPEAHEAFGGTP